MNQQLKIGIIVEAGSDLIIDFMKEPKMISA